MDSKTMAKTPASMMRLGALADGFGLLGGFAFFVVAAFFEDALGQHAEVAHHGNAGGGDGADFFRLADAAFEFHRLRPGGDEAAGGFQRLLRRVVGVDRQIADDQRLRLGAGDGGHVVQHVVERDVGGVRKSEHHHAERIADEQHIHAAFVEQAGGGVVVGGQHRDRAAAFASRRASAF